MAQEFIKGFHMIEGESIGERQKNLQQFLKNVSLSPEEKEFVLYNLKPKTYLENLFYIDVLIYLRDTSQLWNIFQEEKNGAFVSKIMRQPWFFQQMFSNLDPKTFVDKYLPLLSHSMKIKLFRKLPQAFSEEKIDEIFDYVIDRYGLFLATSFITDCSSEKIAIALRQGRLKLSTHQLKKIYTKEPSIIEVYIEEQKQYTKEDIIDDNFLTYIAQKNPVFFWELIRKFNIDNNLKFGSRTTKKLIPMKTQEIVNDPKKYVRYFRYETLVRKLNKQGVFKQLYYNLFPRNVTSSTSRTLSDKLLKYYPKNYRYNLFVTTFNEVTKDDIWHYANCIDDSLLNSISDINLRESWAKLKYKQTKDDDYITFFELKKAIALIKEKINTTTSIDSRERLLCLLVKACAINKDLKQLEEVLKYFCVRHRNDNASTRVEFLEAIETKFNLEELNDTHWKYIHEILTIQNLKKEYGKPNSKLRIKHIEYLFNNNRSEEEKNYFINEYVKVQLLGSRAGLNNLKKINNVSIKKIILLKVLELKKEIKSFDNSEIWAEILLFNRESPEYKIHVENEEFIQILKESLTGKSTTYAFKDNFSCFVRKVNRNDFENEMLSYYFKDGKYSLYGTNVLWYLKHDPMVIVDNFGIVMLRIIPPRTKQLLIRIMNRIKLYSHLSLDEKVVKHSLQQLKNDEDNKSAFILPLSILSSPEEYLKIMEDLDLIPTSAKLAIDDADFKAIYDIQEEFLGNFKNLWEPSKYLPLLLDKFCQGDYLQLSVAPLYSAFDNTSENKLHTHLEILINNKAMSVKKHALFLACRDFDRKKVLQICNKFENDKNDSLLNCLFLSSLKYFLKNPHQEHFDKVLLYMNFLKASDMESLNILTAAQVSKTYKPTYIINVWNLLEKLNLNKDAVGLKPLMSLVLASIDKECMPNMPIDFCKEIINDYFGKNYKSEDEVPSIFSFVINFLMFHNNQNDNFDYVFKMLLKNKQSFCELVVAERKNIYRLFKEFFKLADEKETNIDFITKFSEEWQKIFTPTETFEQHVLLKLLRFKKEAGDDLHLYSKQIVLFAEQVNDSYGEFILSKFIQVLSSNYYQFYDREIELFTHFLKYKMSVVSCILVMELISIKGDLFYKDRINPIYHEIESILKQITDPKVQLCYNLYFKND